MALDGHAGQQRAWENTWCTHRQSCTTHHHLQPPNITTPLLSPIPRSGHPSPDLDCPTLPFPAWLSVPVHHGHDVCIRL